MIFLLYKYNADVPGTRPKLKYWYRYLKTLFGAAPEVLCTYVSPGPDSGFDQVRLIRYRYIFRRKKAAPGGSV